MKPAIAKAAKTELAPTFIKKDSARGAENVTSSDLVIPRLEIVQSLSPCRLKKDAAYIDGAEEGMLFNSVSRELYGADVVAIPIYYRKEWLIWRDRKKGGGFRGSFASELEAKQAVADLDGGFDDNEVQDTAQHFCMLLKPDGSTEDLVISMAKSKLSTSRKWNSLIRLAGGDSFSRGYKITGVEKQNANNETYYSFDVASLGYLKDEAAYLKAEKMYLLIAAGQVQAAHSDEF